MGYRLPPPPGDEVAWQRYLRIGRIQTWLGLVCTIAGVLMVGLFMVAHWVRP